jgi:hypothetical protein
MTDAPERIWASPEHPDENGYGGFWIKTKVAPAVEYVRADLAAAQLQEARKMLKDMVRGAYEVTNQWSDPFEPEGGARWEDFVSDALRDLCGSADRARAFLARSR